MKFISVFILLLLFILVGAALAQEDAPAPTLLVYSSIERLYAGILEPTLPLTDTQAAVEDYPPEWDVHGVATTTLGGESVIEGTVADTRYLWAEPTSDTTATLYELNESDEPGDAEAVPVVVDEPAHEFPFLALALADAETAITIEGEDIDVLHPWLIEQLEAQEIALAGIHIEGEFSVVNTSVVYNLPLTGFVFVDGRVSTDIFHYIDYEEPSNWVIDGVYAADEEGQKIISLPGAPLHLHGYGQDEAVGGHIQRASATQITVTIYPLETIVQLLPEDAAAEE
jgi:alpha-acetolactate decarboxylase